MSAKLLVIDGYDAPARANLDKAGCTRAGTLYHDMAKRHLPDAEIDIIHPADADDALPKDKSVTDYDAALWTGSSLTIYHTTPEVRRQVDLARTLYEKGVPSFGSCWALQIGTLAAGGSCRLNPAGREFGVSRKITLSSEGRAHPLYRGKSHVFDGFTSHFDDVETLAPGAVLLASNAHTPIQAAINEVNGTPFWAVQYHPEYDLKEVAALTRFRMDGLIDEGRFADRQAAELFIADLEALHTNPERLDLSWKLGIDQDVLNPDIRTLEFRNWIDAILLPRLS